MKIKEILKKQGELYKDLTSNKTIQKHNETIEKPKLVPYYNFKIPEQERNAISSLEKMLNEKLVIVNNLTTYNKFEISIDNNQVIYLRIVSLGLTNIPKEISCLTNLKELYLHFNQITEIKNLNNLPNLQILSLHKNPIKNKEEAEKLREQGVKVEI